VVERLWEAFVTATELNLCTAMIFMLAEQIWPAVKGQKRIRRGFVLDLVYLQGGFFLAYFVNMFVISILVDALTATKSVGPALERMQARATSLGSIGGCAVGLVLADLTGYFKHRLFHTKLLWPFHAVHHSSVDVDWLSNERMHPLESILTSLFQLLPLLLLGFPPTVIFIVSIVRRTHSIWEHTNIGASYGPLNRVFVSPVFHRWHHSSDEDVVDRNYANVFSIFDVVFGTYHMPAKTGPEAMGAAAFPRSLWGQIVYPFAELRKMVTSP
jgi:sterol desaturase/sphingolipid hydroxylase (fatty acid hydroxylase superfamily)